MAVQWIKRILLVAALAVMAGGFTWLMWPQPIQVDVAKAILGRRPAKGSCSASWLGVRVEE